MNPVPSLNEGVILNRNTFEYSIVKSKRDYHVLHHRPFGGSKYLLIEMIFI